MKDLEKTSLLSESASPRTSSLDVSYNSTGNPFQPGFDDQQDFRNYINIPNLDPDFTTLNVTRQDSAVDEGITLCWNDIRVTATADEKTKICPCLRKDKSPPPTKQILKGVSGVARAGSFLVIMGASGSGKTTLMNVLTRRNLGKLQVDGGVLANGKSVGDDINSVSGYIQQDDLFVGSLTVGEHLWFNAVLRMGKDVTDDARRKRIQDVLKEMGLKKCENTVIGIPGIVKGISGGEKKRLALASELLTKPSILFCDEPTSGLDSFMAQNVVELLKKLTKNGHTVLCTIHQPSSEVFAMFDEILMMAEGRVAFMGPTPELENFFADHGYFCPSNFNPADYFIMSLAIVPGREAECRDTVAVLCDSYEESSYSRSITYQTEEQTRKCRDRFVVEMEKIGQDKGQSDENDNRHEKKCKRRYEAIWWRQFTMCLWRSSLTARRNKKVLPTRILQLFIIGLVVGVMWWQQPITMSGVSNINGAMFVFMIHVSFNTAFTIATSFAREFPVFLKEHQDRQYTVSAYYLGKVLVDLPVVSLATGLYITCVYWMIGMFPEAGCFLTCLAAMVLLSLVAGSCGHCISALFPNAQMALTLLPLALGLTLLCSGFLIKPNSIPLVFKPLVWVSPFKYTYEILVVNQWENVQHIECDYVDQGYTPPGPVNTSTDHNAPSVGALQTSRWCFPDGAAIIYSFQYNPTHLPICFVALAVICLTVQVLGYASVRYNASLKK